MIKHTLLVSIILIATIIVPAHAMKETEMQLTDGAKPARVWSKMVTGAYIVFNDYRTNHAGDWNARNITQEQLRVFREATNDMREKEIIVLFQVGCLKGANLMAIAAHAGSVAAIDFLLAMGEPISDEAMRFAQSSTFEIYEKLNTARETGLQEQQK